MKQDPTQKNTVPPPEGAEEGQRLTTPEYWSSLVPEGNPGSLPPQKRTWKRWIPAGLKRLAQHFRTAHYRRILHKVLLPPLMSGMEGKCFLEVGSAPGWNGVDFHHHFGLIPYGLEYAESRVKTQQEVHRRNGLSEDWVLHGDFFDDEMLASWHESFDVVASFGFIEHFENPGSVVARHLELLRPGGILLISVPNLGSGTLPGWLANHFNPAVYALHNIETCGPKGFTSLYPPPGCDPVFCGTLGGVHLEVLPDQRRISRWVSRFCNVLFLPLNILNHLLIGDRLWSFSRLSSRRMMIARKQSVPMKDATL